MRIIYPVVALLLLTLTACSTPRSVWNEPVEGASLSDVRTNADGFSGRHVRWGGTIVGVDNVKNATYIEVLHRELNEAAQPDPEGGSSGRFMIRASGFLDPAIYSEGRLITVVGTVAGGTERAFGKTTYEYPVVSSYRHLLWKDLARTTGSGRTYHSLRLVGGER